MKKIFAILMFAAVFGLLIGGVSAAVELVEHDFDGHFKMKVPKNATFKNVDSTGGLIDDSESYRDTANDLNITYIMSPDVNETLVNKSVKPLADKGANVTKKGNMYLIDAYGLNEVISIKDTEMIMVGTTHYDMDTVVNMVNSVKF